MRQWAKPAAGRMSWAVLPLWNVGAIYKKVAGTLLLGALGALGAANSFHQAESRLVRLPAAFSAIGWQLP